MKRFTVDDVLTLHPCGWNGDDDGRNYCRARLERLFAGADSVTIVDILRREEVPLADRIWLATRDGIMDATILAAWANRTADRAVRKHCLECGAPEVESWAERWLSGEDRSRAAAWAAVDAAWAADAADAAWAAADAADAAVAAADAAAWAAARAAAWAVDAAWAAADAAWAAADAERQRQMEDLIALLEEQDTTP